MQKERAEVERGREENGILQRIVEYILVFVFIGFVNWNQLQRRFIQVNWASYCRRLMHLDSIKRLLSTPSYFTTPHNHHTQRRTSSISANTVSTLPRQKHIPEAVEVSLSPGKLRKLSLLCANHLLRREVNCVCVFRSE